MPFKSEYMRAMNGQLDPPSTEARTRAAESPATTKDIEDAVELIIECRHSSANDRGFDAPNAAQRLKEVADTREQLYALERIAMHRAKHDPRYWGVEDPEEERYCALCRTVHPIENFTDDNGSCDRSLEQVNG